MNKRPCIYIAWSKTTGKCYIGSSARGIIFRKRSHLKLARKNSNIKFHLALRELGKEDFVWEILEIIWDNLSIKFLDKLLKDKEEYYINKIFNSFKEGYNSSPTGHSIRSFYGELTLEDKREKQHQNRLSNARKRRATPEWKESQYGENGRRHKESWVINKRAHMKFKRENDIDFQNRVKKYRQSGKHKEQMKIRYNSVEYREWRNNIYKKSKNYLLHKEIRNKNRRTLEYREKAKIRRDIRKLRKKLEIGGN